MKFENASVIIPITRETSAFEQEVSTILDTCNPADLKEFVIVTSPTLTTPGARESVQKMQAVSLANGVPYLVLEQHIPGMGGAMREGLDAATGSHVIIQCADQSQDLSCMPKLIALAKEHPEQIYSVSRFLPGGGLGKGYDGLKGLWNRLSQKYLKLLYPSAITDYTYCYRICPVTYYREVVWEETMHPFALETALKFIRLGRTMLEIPGRQFGGTQSGYRETLLYLPLSLRLRFTPVSNFQKVQIAEEKTS
ncbi:MAG: glycosyltransferase [Succinivibrio sp.]|nr:glycosyltransferase [Succinivibrio sp.]